MKSHLQDPADTRTMAIVHQALRRDLQRSQTALCSPPYPADARRRAIGKHVDWMMRFLHDHHYGEDAGLWPLVRRRNPESARLLDEMAADHARVSAVIGEVAAAANEYAAAAGDDARTKLLEALDQLSAVLLPHLQREEEEMMPVVSASISEDEWRAWDEEYNIKPKSLAELGLEGHWLLDGLDATGYQLVVHLVPPVPRFFLLHGFAKHYRRLSQACWGSDAAAAQPGRGVKRSGSVEVVVDVSREAVWRVLSDVTRVGEWSHECHGAEWLDGTTMAVPGARFRGRNKAGRVGWSRVNEIVLAREPEELAWRTLPTLLYPDSTEWRVRLEAAGSGTRIVQSFQVLQLAGFFDWLYSRVIPAHRDRSSALTDDLRRLAALTEAEQRGQRSDSAARPLSIA